jgi:tetratricopeptide (TPR) repeat protein
MIKEKRIPRMSRKFWIVLIAAVLTLVLLAGGTVAGLLTYRQVRNQGWRASFDEAYAKGDWVVARGFLQNLLPQDPENFDLLLMYADVNRHILTSRRGSLSNVERAYHQILNAHPEKTEYRTDLIALYMDMRNWVALEYYTLEWLEDSPDDDELRYHHALALDRQGRHEDAIEAYRALVDAGTSHTEAWGNLARLLQEVGRDETGLSTLDEAMAKNPDDGLIRMHRAVFLARERKWDAVEADLAEARRLAPDDVDVLLTSGQLAALHQDWDTALAFGEKALEQAPDRPDVVSAVAGLYTNHGEPEKGIEILEQLDAAALVDHPEILVTLADSLVSLDRQDEADPYIKMYADAYPGQLAITEYFEARRLLAASDAAGAVEKLRVVTERMPSFSPARLALGLAYLEAGKRDLARDSLETYLRNNPGDTRAEALYNKHFGVRQSVEEIVAKGRELLSQGAMGPESLLAAAMALFDASSAEGDVEAQLGLVRTLLDKAIEKSPDYAPAYRFLGDVMVAVGDMQGAREALKRATEAGVAESELARTYAGVAVLDGNPDRALALFRKLQQDQGPNTETATGWAAYFESLGRRNLALEVLGLALAASETQEARLAIEVARISAAARGDNPAEAVEILNEAAPGFGPERPAWAGFNEAKLAVVRALVRQNTSDGMRAAERLIAEVRDAEIESADRSAVEGMLALQRDPPDLDAAWEWFQEALRLQSGHVNALAGLARVAANRGDFSQALEFSEQAVARAPRSLAIRRQHAELQVLQGRHQDAVRTLRFVLNEEPTDAATLDLFTRALLGAGQPEAAAEALARYEAAVGNDPAGLERVRELESLVALGTGDYAGAEAVLRKQVAAHPDDLALLRGLVRAVRGQGRVEEAEVLLRKYVQQHSENPAAWTALAEFYLDEPGSEPLEEASSALTRALILDANHVPALRGMLLLQLRQDRHVEALGMCDRVLALVPGDAEVLFRKATLLAREIRTLPEALESIEAAVAVEEKIPYLAARGVILSQLGRHEDALSDLRTVSKSKARTSALVDLAFAASYASTGEAELARGYLKEAEAKSQKGDWINGDRLDEIREQIKQLESES